MRSNALKRVFVLFCLVATQAPAEVLIERIPRCVGGDGPHPLADVSDHFTSEMAVIPTGGAIKEFALTPIAGSVVFRRDNDEVFFRSFLEPSAVKMATSGLPLDTFVHPGAKYFSTRHAPWVYDMHRSRWWHYDLPAKNLHHAFWDNDTLYSYSVVPRVGSHNPDVNIYRYRVGNKRAEPFCSVRNFRLAKGHQFPLMHFFSSFRTSHGFSLTLSQLDVRQCRIVKELVFQDPIAGPVEEVHRFEPLKSTVIKVRHPQSNLLWQSSKHGCHYHNLEGATPLVFNYHSPLIASFSESQGLRVINLREKKAATLFGAGEVQALQAEHLALSPGGRHLFVAPVIEGYEGKGRPLLRLDLSKFNASQKPALR